MYIICVTASAHCLYINPLQPRLDSCQRTRLSFRIVFCSWTKCQHVQWNTAWLASKVEVKTMVSPIRSKHGSNLVQMKLFSTFQSFAHPKIFSPCCPQARDSHGFHLHCGSFPLRSTQLRSSCRSQRGYIKLWFGQFKFDTTSVMQGDCIGCLFCIFLHPIGPTGPPHLPIEGRQHSTKLGMVVRISATKKGFRSKSSPNSPRRFFLQKSKRSCCKEWCGVRIGKTITKKHLKNSSHGLSLCKSHFVFDLVT